MTRFSENADVPERILTLRNAVEASFLSSVLDEEGIPHKIVTHRSMFNEGIFSVTEGWGHVEAPASFGPRIKEIYADISSDNAEVEPDKEP